MATVTSTAFLPGATVHAYERDLLPGRAANDFTGASLGSGVVDAAGEVSIEGLDDRADLVLSDGTRKVRAVIRPDVSPVYSDGQGGLQTRSGESVESPVGSVIGTTITSVSASGGDDTAAVQAALDAGDVLLLGEGVPFNVGYVSHEGSSRRIIALGPVDIVQTDPQGVFNLRGGWDELASISSIATNTSTDLVEAGESNPSTSRTAVSTLTLGASATVTRGDVLKVVSDDINPGVASSYGTATHKIRAGEHGIAGLSSTGTTVTLTNVLIDPAVYATNTRLARLWDVSFEIAGPISFGTAESIRDGVFYGDGIVSIRAAKHSRIEGLRFADATDRCIVNHAYCTSIVNCRANDGQNRPSLQHYGALIGDGGWMTRVSDCHAENPGRHVYSEGQSTVTADSDDLEYYGGGYLSVVSGCTGFATQGGAFDTHQSSYGVHFTGCKAFGSYQGADSGGSGFTTRGRKTTLADCEADSCWVGFSVHAPGSRLDNCRARRSYFQALVVTGRTDQATTTTDDVEISGGEYETLTGFSCVVIGSTGFTAKVRMVNWPTLRMLQPGSGAKYIEMLGTSPRLDFDGLRVDAAASTVAGGLNVFWPTVDSAVIRGRGLHVDAVGSAATGFTFFNHGADGEASDMAVRDIVYESGALSPTIKVGTLTNVRYSSRLKWGTPQNAHSQSAAPSLTAAASATLPIADRLDPEITVRLTGSAGAVTLAAIPAPLSFQHGQIINVINNSNGDVTITSGGAAIPADGTARYVYHSGSWRRL